ncbi:MAG: bifunctional DNA-formamidopyrimidine glycosylase/DNA-(apurinic or apyrimidinic site) lyase [Gammaproteobacteria bacterium]|nr:bifunctional DNA-formamidopyrimidine glycosylase/DNA-(apurinic or apyrimidinic site) lyase [Gammaproteobacteria bacterium]
MPELPEVETTRRGIAPLLTGRTVARVVTRNAALRWRVPRELGQELVGGVICGVRRRGKYLLIEATGCNVLVHLGMSGSLRVAPASSAPSPHDHIDIVLEDGSCLRYCDPRRFGAFLLAGSEPDAHWLLRDLGPEPLGAAFTGEYLYRRSRGRRVAVKSYLMNARVVAGIGNIYASEALFEAGIHPMRAAGRVGRERYQRLAESIKSTLRRAIAAGGTSLRDFVGADGRPGYFSLSLRVYGREGEPCPVCRAPVARRSIGQRSSFLCPRCQR